MQTPQERYEADRMPGLSPDWEQLAPMTRVAYVRNWPRYRCVSFVAGPTPGCIPGTKRARAGGLR